MLIPKSKELQGSDAAQKMVSTYQKRLLCFFIVFPLHLRSRHIINHGVGLSFQGKVCAEIEHDILLQGAGKQGRSVYVNGRTVIYWWKADTTLLIGKYGGLPTPAFAGTRNNNNLPDHWCRGYAVSKGKCWHKNKVRVKKEPPAKMASGPTIKIGFTVNKIQANSWCSALTCGMTIGASVNGVSEPKQRLPYQRPMIARVMVCSEVVEPEGLLPDYVYKVETLGRPPPVISLQS